MMVSQNREQGQSYTMQNVIQPSIRTSQMVLITTEKRANLYSNCHEGPAGIADVALLAAGPHIIIVCQIYIKHQLTLHRCKYPICCQACTQLLKSRLQTSTCSVLKMWALSHSKCSISNDMPGGRCPQGCQ